MNEEGVVYLHLDERMNHNMKVVMDEIFGKENFQNSLVWRRTNAHNMPTKTYTRTTDTILFYSRSLRFSFNLQFGEYGQAQVKRYKPDKNGRLYTGRDLTFSTANPSRQFRWRGTKPPPNRSWGFSEQDLENLWAEGRILVKKDGTPRLDGLKVFLDEAKGSPVTDIWTDISRVGNTSSERLDYPTQKPEALLERIVLASSNPGDLVMDVFAGSGTTAAVAEKLGRRWIVCDFGKHAIYTTQKRMLRIGESKALGKDVKKNQKYGQPPKPFCVVSTEAYDFSRIMKLREYKDAYIDFVLGLFQLSRAEQDLAAKYKLTNIYAEKDGDPVEVYPVWDDEYLKNIRIDDQYFKGIIRQSRRTLKKDYYIITPETCTIVGDRTLPNGSGGTVDFKLLKFPYKILEDVSRNFQMHEQPSSPENVNNLINSTGFYFNEAVEIEVKKTKDGLKISRFETKILDKQGERFKGLDGLAMLLVDIDYDGKLFEVDRTLFLKDIGENGAVKIGAAKGKVAVIAIDKHGNESKPLILKG